MNTSEITVLAEGLGEETEALGQEEKLFEEEDNCEPVNDGDPVSKEVEDETDVTENEESGEIGEPASKQEEELSDILEERFLAEEKEPETADRLSDDEITDDEEIVEVDNTKVEEDTIAFEKSVTIDGVKITVAAEEGVFPEGAKLSVEKVTNTQEKQAQEAVESERSEGQNVAVSYTYDIKVLGQDGNEIEPADSSKVKVTFKLEEVADDNLTTNVYHITEEAEEAGNGELVAEKLTVETEGDTATVETDGFSFYTVEFTYNDLQYVLSGNSKVELSKILSTIGLSGEATEVSVSDSSLFSAAKNDSGEWIVTAHRAFNTEEWMKVAINDVVYQIIVTDSESVTYLDATGAEQTCSTYKTVTSGTTLWNGDWYVVSSSTTINNRISVSGTVNLILGNGATLTASKGITVGSDAAFNIYAQSDDEATMGALVATAAENSNNAAIGGVNNTNFGTIVINGGKITATTSNGGAGIGGGYGSNGGSITINGGIVSATAGDYSNSAGIGGGNSGYVASVTLNGGIITATGDTHYGGAGIGTGAYAGSGTMTITIGSGVKKLVATKGDDSDCIGKESHANTTVNVVFKNGETTVEGDDKDAVFYDTGEGSVRQIRAKAMNHAVTMSNDLKANITANPEYALAGETVTLTLGAAVDASMLSVNDGTSDLTLTDAGNRQYTFTMPDGDVTVTATAAQSYAVNLPANMEIVSATNTADGGGKYITGTIVTFKPEFGYEASNVSDGNNTLEPDANGIYSVTVATTDITITATVGRSATIDLTDATGDFTAIDNDVLTGSTAHTVTITDGASITLNNATISGGIVCEGTATINLVGTNSVSGWNGYDSNIGAVHYSAGIQIGGSGTTLTINGDGSLTATGGDGSAGIGLNYAWNVTDDVVGGNIVINGGTITANGGTGGAGIGTSEIKDANNNSSRKAIIGNITITGGTVTAVGGSNADGIGSGKNAYGATIQIGTVTIYDGIDKVDASSIKDFANVVYKHGETNVTDNKTDYFTIGEDGDRRIITPKDDTDYTITIADGIENGTISAAATAKYMQMVTVTATPAFGYRLVRLIVKDGENNDVASTYNTFLMPKGNVTVSAEFALGSHGTTEFTWRYSTGEGPQDQVLETIYDGVTTVNIQQTERSYNILKYENEYNYSKFKLDNNTYEASIPYAGGTGEFYGTGNGTNFRIPNNGNTGYYDITLIDVGNGKWSVSILPTAALMDEVPDQTYTGSAITPEPLVIAGSLSLTKGTDYTYSYTNNTNVGTATVRATFQGDYASLGYVEKEFTIAKATPAVTAPTAVENLIYNGSAQALVNAGNTDFGTLLYSLDGQNYSDDIPTGTDAGTYTVYYKVEGSDNWNAVAAQTIEVTIREESSEPVFSGHQLVLSGQIGVRFGMNLSILSADEKAGSYMEFTVNGRTTRVNTSDATVADDGRYIYTCFVTSIQMAETITAVFHYNDETVQQTYSVKDYIDYIEAHSTEFDATTISLVRAIADYGHYVQPFLSATNNWTIGTDYAGMSTYYTTTYDINTVKGNVSGYQLALTKGSSKVDTAYMRLTLDSETTLSVRLTVEDDTELTANATFHGNTYNAVKQSDGAYIIKITDIPAAWLGDTVTITGTAGGEFTVNVSALSYVYSVLNSNTMNQEAKNAVASIYYYYIATEAYRTAHNL